MGDDWCRMTIPIDVNQDKLIDLIDKQLLGYRDWVFRIYDHDIFNPHYLSNPYVHPTTMGIPAETAHQQYVDASSQLENLIIIDKTANGYVDSHRMSPIGRNELFPYSWRIDAYRSILPNELPEILNKWRSYVEAIQNGEYSDYLFEWFLYTEGQRLLDFWTALNRYAKLVKDSIEYQKLVKSMEIPTKVLEVKKPATYPAPFFDEKNSSSSIIWEKDSHYLELIAQFDMLHDLRHEWNRNILKRKYLKLYKSGYPFGDYKINFANLIKSSNDPFLDSLFNWLQQCVDDNKGLFLWC